MAATVENTAVDLVREARRRRFTDPALEARFGDERQAQGRLRSQVTAALALLFVALTGWNDSTGVLETTPENLGWELYHRFFVVVPFWLMLFVSSILPGHGRRAEWVYGSATVGALLGLALMRVGVTPVSTVLLTLDFGLVLLTSSVVLPLRLRTLLLTAGLANAGVVALIYVLRHPPLLLLLNVDINLTLTALVSVAVGWGRERNDRLLFAEREQARRLAQQLVVANGELARVNTALAVVNAEQAAFMGIAAHDLRAPLATVRGYAELLRGGRLRDEEAKGKALGEIETQAARMLALVSDYLGAHAATGRAEPARVERVDVAASARAAVARHAVAAAGKGQRLEMAGARGTGGAEGAYWARADEARLAQIVDNFVGNALKFSPRETVVKIAVTRGGEAAVRLGVSDDGPGIAAEERAGLWRMFARGSARPTGGEASHGLGLAVAKRLAESMGGAVGCESEVGRGATFWVEVAGAEASSARAES